MFRSAAPQPTFCVLDTETTGLHPGFDRIVELALIDVASNGEVLGNYTTLLQPGRDIGPTRIHGISAADVTDAPTFAEVLPDILPRLAGRILVAHNAMFDLRFLEAEFDRAGHPLGGLNAAYLCTLNTARTVLPNCPRYRLVDICSYLRIPLTDAHSALGDATATAALLSYYLDDKLVGGPALRALRISAAAVTWPSAPPGPATAPRSRQQAHLRREEEAAFLPKLVASRPAGIIAGSEAVQTYLSVLDDALADGRVSAVEKEQLQGLTISLGLGADELHHAHETYLLGLAATALAHGAVSVVEERDLHDVAHLLGFDAEAVPALLARARAEHSEPLHLPSALRLFQGQSVAFTGETLTPRTALVEAATQAGLRVVQAVGVRTAVVVVADAVSVSAKASKAAELGVRLVTEGVFLRLLDDVGLAADKPVVTRKPKSPTVRPAPRKAATSTAARQARTPVVPTQEPSPAVLTAPVRTVSTLPEEVPSVESLHLPTGWYADPWRQAGLRWWDGCEWTAITQGATAPAH